MAEENNKVWKQIGAIWVKEKGLSIQISEDVKEGNYFAFPNQRFTEGSNQPKWQIAELREKEKEVTTEEKTA